VEVANRWWCYDRLVTFLGQDRSDFKTRTRTLVLKLLDIEHRDLDPLLSQQVYHNLSDSIAASSHHDHLLVPVIRILTPVVRHCIVKPRAGTTEQTPGDQGLEVFVCRRMFGGEYVALRSVARGEKERDCEGRIERRQLEEPANCIPGDA
jgi:hypothetical protein